jgi:hypothetical protein
MISFFFSFYFQNYASVVLVLLVRFLLALALRNMIMLYFIMS